MKLDAFWRFQVVQWGLLLAGLAIIAQITLVQIKKDKYTNNPDRNWLYAEVRADRGEIFDRNGNVLATNKPVYEIGVDLNKINDEPGEDDAAREIAMTLQVIFELNFATVMEEINWEPGEDDSPYVMLANFATYEDVQAFIALREAEEDKGTTTGWNLQAVYFVPHMVRTYPEKTVAANILGLTTLFDACSYGVEEFYDSILAGETQLQWIPNNPNLAEKMPEKPEATSLILTIDRDIQFATEQILDAALIEHGAESGVIIVADPKNGEILAMANSPRVDPNEYWEYELVTGELPYNAAISYAYEPGSVIKILTMAAALDAGVVTSSDTYDDFSGVYDVGGGYLVPNWDREAHGTVTMTECLQLSLNVCLADVAIKRLGEEQFYDYMQRFGLGHLTGIDLAGEEPGRLKLPTDKEGYTVVELGINSFGQGVSVTPVQMIMAGSAIANGGRMVRPHVLRATVLEGVQHDMPIELVGTPITEETAEILESMLVVSLENETSLPLVEGYQIAGKTGTAEIRHEETALTNASFIGWGPVDDPQFIVYVWLHKPTESIWGSQTAAPVFKDVVQKLVLLMNIPPDGTRLELNGQIGGH